MALSLSDLFYNDPFLNVVMPRGSSVRASTNNSNTTMDGGMLGATDVLEYADRWEFLVDVPGVDESSLSVELNESTLSIKGERRHGYEPKKAKRMDKTMPTDKSGAATTATTTATTTTAADKTDKTNGCSTNKCDTRVDSAECPQFDVHRVERSFGSFARSFKLPHAVDSGKICAESKNGVLTITIPKVPTKQPSKIPITFTKPTNSA